MRVFVLSLLLGIGMLGVADSAFAIDPNALVTCDGVTAGGVPCDFCKFMAMVEKVVNFMVGILILISVIMLAVTGVQMAIAASDGSDARQLLKDRMTNIVIGFFLIIASWTIVDTLLKALVSDGNLRDNWRTPMAELCGSMSIPGTQKVEIDFPGAWPGSVEEYAQQIYDISGEYPASVAGCEGVSCVALAAACKNAASCTVAPSIASNIDAFHSAVTAAGIGGTRVTEAYPPTRQHKSSCHYNGTCVDYSRAGGLSPSEVVAVMNAARSNGLRPVYEVKTQSEKDAIVRAGGSASSVQVLGNWISAPHFSIYGN